MKEDHDWSKFCLRININAKVQDIYNYWTTQNNLEKWFLRKAEFTNPDDLQKAPDSSIEKGDSYLWLWYGYSDDFEESGEILEINGKDFLQFTFGNAGTVTVRIITEHGENLVELWQENIPTDEKSRAYYYMGCSNGWTFYLTNLKSILEGGIDLRNRNDELKQMINA
ncbi:MAG: SRPBCC domain-containing protein [Marinifilaceae bacterium]